jgi:hypothetical protein
MSLRKINTFILYSSKELNIQPEILYNLYHNSLNYDLKYSFKIYKKEQLPLFDDKIDKTQKLILLHNQWSKFNNIQLSKYSILKLKEDKKPNQYQIFFKSSYQKFKNMNKYNHSEILKLISAQWNELKNSQSKNNNHSCVENQDVQQDDVQQDNVKQDNIQQKKKACIDQGYKYEIWCFNSKGEKVELDQ